MNTSKTELSNNSTILYGDSVLNESKSSYLTKNSGDKILNESKISQLTKNSAEGDYKE
ncbi:MAG: hypothetical protein MJ252_15810 [archaeon]|nr:hypothetical protein [archaeon]